jgi:hypothetical protein
MVRAASGRALQIGGLAVIADTKGDLPENSVLNGNNTQDDRVPIKLYDQSRFMMPEIAAIKNILAIHPNIVSTIIEILSGVALDIGDQLRD